MRNNRRRRKNFKIIKSGGNQETFSRKKLLRSLERSGLDRKECQNISNKVSGLVEEGSNTKEIFRKTYNLVKETSPLASVHYSLKKSLFDLGPEGHHFESYVARFFEEIGFETQTCRTLQGKFIKHEVDVISTLRGKRYFTECKFHNRAGIKNDAKISLYVKARWDDLREGPEGKNLNGFYIASNTAFSLDAISYAKGTGMQLLGVNAPEKESFLDTIKKLRLYPVTSLRNITKPVKKMLLARKITVAKDLLFHENLLFKFGLSEPDIERVIKEINYLQKARS